MRLVPNRDIPLINQANGDEPAFARVQAPTPRHAQQPFVAPVIETSYSSEEAHRIPLTQLNCYLPDRIFISSVLPTRTPRELARFIEYCQDLVLTRPQVIYYYPLGRISDVTTSPLNFQNLLWKSRVTINHLGIKEEYSWIRRHRRRNHPDQAKLEPAYEVHYNWSTAGWSIVQLPTRSA